MSDLRAFVAVAKFLSFHQAGRELSLSPPQVSKRIAALEAKLQRTLFVRSTRKVHLTQEGERFLSQAQLTLDAMNQAEDFFQGPADAVLEGLVSITMAQTVAQRLMGSPLAAFHKLHPKVKFDVHLSDHYADLIHEGFDLAVRIMKRGANSELRQVKIGENAIVFCASPAYLKKNPKIKKVEDLKEHTVLAIKSHLSLRFIKSAKKLSSCIEEPWLASNGDMLVEQACLGNAVIVRSKWGVQRELESGALVEVRLDDGLESDTQIYLVFPERKYIPQRVRSLIDFIKTWFKSA